MISFQISTQVASELYYFGLLPFVTVAVVGLDVVGFAVRAVGVDVTTARFDVVFGAIVGD